MIKRYPKRGGGGQSALQTEVQSFKTQLIEMCALENYAFKSTKLDEIVSLEMEEQFDKIADPNVQAIVRDLPSHCHNNEAIDFFKKLNTEEAAKVASYLSLEYREIDRKTDKATLLEQDIPKMFKEVNVQLLEKLKEDDVINEDVFEKLEALADKIPPELMTRSIVSKWSAQPDKIEESNLNNLLHSARRKQEPSVRGISMFRDSERQLSGRNEREIADTPRMNS